jgi:predicted ATPase
MLRYRLLDTTRAYALEIPIEATEHANLAIRHVTYYGRWLEQIAPDWSALATTTERAPYFDALGNVRAALEWCFDDAGDLNAGVVLAAASGPAFLAMSLLPEARRWSGSAIKVLDGTVRGSSHEMHLQAVFGVSSTLLQGKSEAALQALNRGLEIAESLDDAINQVGLLGMIRTFYFRSGDFRTAFLYAQRCRTVSERIDDVAASAQARSLLGRSLHLMGDLAAARVELEASLQLWSTARRATIYLSHELHYPSEVTLARNLWLQGYPAQAEQRAEKIIETAGQIDRPAALAVVLGWAASVFLWTGNWQKAGKHIEAIVYHAETNSLGPFIAAGRARMGELAILRGSAQSGVEDLRAGLQTIHAVGYETLTTELSLSLVHGLRLIGQFDEGMDLVDQTISKVEVNGDDLYMPELLRIRGAVLLEMSARDDEAESCFTRALDLSRQQGAKGWELRAAIDLARLMALRGQPSAAHDILHPVFDSFVEGSRTADLRQAKRLLAGLAS